MRTTSILGTAALLGLLISAPALAMNSEDAAYDKGNSPVTSVGFGNCVRTKWMGGEDPCAPAKPAPAPVPVAAPAPAAVPEVALEQRTIYFDFDSAVLTGESQAKLDQLGEVINASSAIADVRIHGFTDQLGTSGYNEALAAKRAAAVKAYLDGKSRLSSTVAEVKGLGKSSPAEGCGTMKRDAKIACMAKERRVEIEFKAQR